MALIWLSAGLILAGLFTSGQVLLLGLIGLALLPISKGLAQAQLAGLTFARRLPRRVFSGESFSIEVSIGNENQRIATSDLLVLDPMSDAASRSFLLPFIRGQTSCEVVWMGRIFRRGRDRQNSISVTSRWPLGLFEARFETHFQSSDGQGEDVLVVPRPLTPSFLAKALGQMERESALLSAVPPDALSEFRYLREFQSGDAIRSIHWPSSTRSGQLYIKENDPPAPAPNQYALLIHSFATPGEVIRNDRFETALRIATGLVIEFQKQNASILFAPPFAGDAILHASTKAGFATILDQIALTPVRHTNDLDSALLCLEKLASCDQVFVLGAAPRSAWEDAAREILPICVCIDSDSLSGARKKSRLPLTGKVSRV